jgi:drug/metabolite transporter superfamily protein YnfA
MALLEKVATDDSSQIRRPQRSARHRSYHVRLDAIAALGILSLIGFAVALTRVDTAFAGRAYAAYGGIYIAASLVWLWLVEGQQPTATDMLGAGITIIGALVIVGWAART